jgi:hypothetical protein
MNRIIVLDKGNFFRAPHPVHSPKWSPYDFWLFGMLKHWMTDRQLQSPKEMLDPVTERCEEITFEELQRVFLTWIERLESAVHNGGEYFIDRYNFNLEIFRMDEIIYRVP